jgi:thioredoxin-like negative regulator of GroEL
MRIFAIVLSVLSVLAAKTKITKEQLEELVKEADSKIHFITPLNFDDFISGEFRMVFYGAKWCKYCKKLTPRWLKLEDGLKSSPLYNQHDLKVAKFDCTDEEGYCAIKGAEGYPTIMFYHYGKLVEEYLGDHNTKDIAEYLLAKMTFLQSQQQTDQTDHNEL